MTGYEGLPADLPVPIDDGAADHLVGLQVPASNLRSTDGSAVDLSTLGPERSIVYFYPLTGQPGVDLPDGWDAIPGARGCTPEACDFRDHFELLKAAGVRHVYGVSSQTTQYQSELVARLHLPFPMLSDETLELAHSLDLPSFEVPGHGRLFARLTMVLRANQIEHVFYPIFPPTTHAQRVLDWLLSHKWSANTP
jgi:peroxiredoxin